MRHEIQGLSSLMSTTMFLYDKSASTFEMTRPNPFSLNHFPKDILKHHVGIYVIIDDDTLAFILFLLKVSALSFAISSVCA